MWMLQPREQPVQRLSVEESSQTRVLKRKSRVVSAPTGQRSVTHME